MSTIQEITNQFAQALRLARVHISGAQIWEDGHGEWWLAEKVGYRKLNGALDADAWLILALEAMSVAGKLGNAEGYTEVEGRKLYRVRQDLAMWDD
jgi:hypothetical protein